MRDCNCHAPEKHGHSAYCEIGEIEELKAKLKAAEAVIDAVERTGLDINQPDPLAPDRHSDVYSLDNETVRLIGETMTAWRKAREEKPPASAPKSCDHCGYFVTHALNCPGAK